MKKAEVYIGQNNVNDKWRSVEMIHGIMKSQLSRFYENKGLLKTNAICFHRYLWTLTLYFS